jgi:SNF2 family DNA or RNA helicase
MQARRARFLVGTAATGGVGITVTASTIVVYMSNTFKYVDRVQSEDRAHRAGQTHKVTIIDVIAENTIDEDVVAALAVKQDLADWLHVSLDGIDTTMIQSPS